MNDKRNETEFPTINQPRACRRTGPGPGKIPVGISACLMGHEVRYNGGHKQSRYCLSRLAPYFDFQPVCPEVGIGMGVPRQPIRLVGNPDAPRAVGVDNPELDVTEQLQEFAARTCERLQGIAGYILIKNSPSCGMERVKVYRENGYPNEQSSAGIFAAELMRRNPLLPVEEEGRLHDPVLRDNFIIRVFAYDQWLGLVEDGLTAKRLIDFHSRYKYMVMAHHYESYRLLGRLLSNLKERGLEETGRLYIEGLMGALSQRANRKSHANVMLHLLGYLKQQIDSATKADLLDKIEQYRQGKIPLVAAMTLLNHYLRRLGSGYVNQQAYLQPHPEDLGLRNDI